MAGFLEEDTLHGGQDVIFRSNMTDPYAAASQVAFDGIGKMMPKRLELSDVLLRRCLRMRAGLDRTPFAGTEILLLDGLYTALLSSYCGAFTT